MLTCPHMFTCQRGVSLSTRCRNIDKVSTCPLIVNMTKSMLQFLQSCPHVENYIDMSKCRQDVNKICRHFYKIATCLKNVDMSTRCRYGKILTGRHVDTMSIRRRQPDAARGTATDAVRTTPWYHLEKTKRVFLRLNMVTISVL